MTTSAAARPAASAAQRRREHRAWYFYDWANSAYVTTTAGVLFSPYLTAVATEAACPDLADGETCTESLFELFGTIPISPESLPFYAVPLATIISAFILPVVGAVADRSARQKSILGGFAWVGSVAAASMFFITGDNWQLGVALLLVANVCLGSSLVVYDAILCQIATPDERDRVSSRGWAFGYLAGFLLLAVNFTLVTLHESIGLTQAEAVRVSMLSAGIWWGVFTLVPVIGLRNRMPVDVVPVQGSIVTASFKQLAATLRDLRGYRQTWKFLLAYLLFNDGIQTVIGVSSTFGAFELGFSNAQILQTFLVVQLVAFFGALIFGRIAARVGAKRTVLAGLGLWAVVVFVGYFLPEGRYALFLALGVLIGLVLGGTQALSRSLYSQLVPAGREAEYFSLYQAAERGTSWFGTLLFGLVLQVTDSYRPAIFSLVVFFVLGGLLLARVDVRRGIAEAGNAQPVLV